MEGRLVETMTTNTTTIMEVIRIGRHMILYRNGAVRAITRSHTMATVMHLEILSGISDSATNERVLSFHVRYWCGQNISPQVKTICVPLIIRCIVSATARLVRNFAVVLEVSVFRMTIRLRTLPKIPGMIMIGHITQYVTVLIISSVYTSLPGPGVDVTFPVLNKSVTLSPELSVV